jgi:hypothetical protein
MEIKDHSIQDRLSWIILKRLKVLRAGISIFRGYA